MVKDNVAAFDVSMASTVLSQEGQGFNHCPEDPNNFPLRHDLALATIVLQFILQRPLQIGILQIHLYLGLAPTGKGRLLLMFEKVTPDGEKVVMKESLPATDELK